MPQKNLTPSKNNSEFVDSDCTYFLCPDPDCTLFTKPNCWVPCEKECPKKAKKAIVCWHCGSIILLPFNHSIIQRVTCRCRAENFQRMSSRYRRANLPADLSDSFDLS